MAVIVILTCNAATQHARTAYSFQYHEGEEVVLWMNTIGPYHNRQETYTYFSLPFCRGHKASISHYHETLGEALLGVELDLSGLDMQFKGFVLFFELLLFRHSVSDCLFLKSCSVTYLSVFVHCRRQKHVFCFSFRRSGVSHRFLH